MDLETIYKNRLGIEAFLRTPSEFLMTDFNDGLRITSLFLKACTDEQEYQAWKNAYLRKRVNEADIDDYVTVKYMYRKQRPLSKTVEKEDLKIFLDYLEAEPVLTFVETCDATLEQVRMAIELEAGDEDVNQLVLDAFHCIDLDSLKFNETQIEKYLAGTL